MSWHHVNGHKIISPIIISCIIFSFFYVDLKELGEGKYPVCYDKSYETRETVKILKSEESSHLILYLYSVAAGP